MSDRDDNVLVQDMIGTAREATAFCKGRQPTDVARDRQLALATVKCLEIIGEAAWKLSDDAKQRQPDLPWEQIIAMRHKPVHHYSKIDDNKDWATVQDDLPQLLLAMEADEGGF